MGFNGEYVVGFIGNDGSLGRTISGEHSVALEAMKVLFDETESLIAPPPEYWDDHCSYRSDIWEPTSLVGWNITLNQQYVTVRS